MNSQLSTSRTPLHQRFLELRAQGASYNTIAIELRVSRRTLFNWKAQLETELSWDETLEMESLREELLGTRPLIAHRLAKRLEAIEAELDKRSLADLSTARLFSMADSLRRQIMQVTTPGKLRLHSSEAKAKENTHCNQPLDLQDSQPSDPAEPLGVEAELPTGAPECKNSAMLVQPTSPGLPDSAQVSAVEPQPAAVSPEQSLKPELPVDWDVPSEASSETHPPAVPLGQPPIKHSRESDQNGCASVQPTVALPTQDSPRSQPLRCPPISSERLIGAHCSFREVLERRRMAKNPSVP